MMFLRILFVTLAVTWTSGTASAQEWPARNLRIVVPFPAGGSFDTQARVIADELSKSLGRAVVVDNKPGAGGTIGATEASRAAPDGYTLFMGSNGTQAANVFLFSKLAYDPEKDFEPLTLVTDYPLVIVPGTETKASSLAELISALKRESTNISYGSSGVGSPTHLAGELFKREIGLNLTHVPYRGQGPALNDLLGGRLTLMFPSVPDVLAHLTAGKLRALAIMASTRSKVLPDVPTTSELGHPRLVSSIWCGLYLPTGTPKAVKERLHAELVRIISSAAFRNVVEPLGFEVKPMDPKAFADFNAAERQQLGAFIKETGIKLD